MVDELRHAAIPDLLDRIRAARAAGEPWGAARETDVLIARSLPRVRNVVASFRLPEDASVSVARDDREDVAQDAARRAFSMLDRFRGTTEGEWYAAVVTCARFTCRDHLRATMTAERRLAGRFEDAPRGDDSGGALRGSSSGGEPGRFTAELATLAERERLDAEAAAEAADWLARALETLPNPNQRRTIELMRDGWSTADIAAELGTSVDNVHQLRSRGFAHLRKDRP